MFSPNFQITPSLTKALMEIEAVRQVIIELPFDVEMLRRLRETARLLTTHYSTQIEGNRLTQSQVAEALSVGDSRNYHMGRAEAEVTGFVDYFCHGMAEAFTAIRTQAATAAGRGSKDQSALLRQLAPRQREVLVLFKSQGTATTAEIATHLGLSPRTVTALCRSWITDGFLAFHDPSRKNRSYRLVQAFEELV